MNVKRNFGTLRHDQHPCLTLTPTKNDPSWVIGSPRIMYKNLIIWYPLDIPSNQNSIWVFYAAFQIISTPQCFSTPRNIITFWSSSDHTKISKITCRWRKQISSNKVCMLYFIFYFLNCENFEGVKLGH